MANISYTKKANNTWKLNIKQGKKYHKSKSGFTKKEEAEEKDKKNNQGMENVGYGSGCYLMSNGMTVADLCHIWVEENPSTSETKPAKDRIALKIAEEYFSNYYFL